MSQGPGSSQPSKLSNPNAPGLLSRHDPEAGDRFPELWHVSGEWGVGRAEKTVDTQGQMQAVLLVMLSGGQGLPGGQETRGEMQIAS